MANTSFRIPRLPDRQWIDCLHRIAEALELKKAQFFFHSFSGGPSETLPFSNYEQHGFLREILPLNQPTLESASLLIGQHHVISIRRVQDSLFDSASFNWNEGQHGLSPASFAKLVGVAKRELGEVKIGEAFNGFPNEEVNKYYEARDATLTRLESVTTDLLFSTQKRLKELDEEFQQRVDKLNAEVTAQREGLKKEFEAKEAAIREQEEAVKKEKSEFDTRESKYLRRQLRQDMLKRLADLSQKFELTKGTRNLRWPIIIFTLVFLGFFGTMTVLSFTQTADLIKAAGQDISKLNWWQLGFLVLKQLGFAAAFLGGSWFFIRWNDRWFRQHADAEFMFKQLELDINRASWVVEMALEWKEEKGHELPPDLLDRLTCNLFNRIAHDSDSGETQPELASVLLGSAANLKIKAPSGAEIELDRKGLRNAIKQTEN